MKKKIFMAVMAFALVLCTSIAFVGCGGPKVTAIELATEIKTEYCIGEDLELDDALLQVEYEDETYKVIDLEKSMVKGFNTDTIGTRTMTIVYQGLICKVQYKVTGPKLTEEKYVYYNSSNNHCVYIYKNGEVYNLLEYSTSLESSGAQEWENLKSQTYLNDRIANGYLLTATQTLNNTDYYYYLIGIPNKYGEGDLDFKIISLTNWVEVSNPTTNLLEDYELYIPQA